MKIADLITMAENRLAALNNEMATAIQHGFVDDVVRIEALVTETQTTLDALRSLVA